VVWLRQLCAVIVLVLLGRIGNAPGNAAEMTCESRLDYGTLSREAEEVARQLWPGGFRPTKDMCLVGYLHGTIVKGDYEKFQTFYKNNWPLMGVIDLVSPAGDVDEAIKIGQFFRIYRMTISTLIA
jgi:hypothetical protein